MHLQKSASQCQIKATIVESKINHRTLVDIERPLPILRLFEQYPQILSQTIHFLLRFHSGYQLSIISKFEDPTY